MRKMLKGQAWETAQQLTQCLLWCPHYLTQSSPQSHEEIQESGCPFYRLGNQPSGRFLQGHRLGSGTDQKCSILCLACPSLCEGDDLGSHVKLINVGCWQG